MKFSIVIDRANKRINQMYPQFPETYKVRRGPTPLVVQDDYGFGTLVRRTPGEYALSAFLDTRPDIELRMLLMLVDWGNEIVHGWTFNSEELLDNYCHVSDMFPTKVPLVQQLMEKLPRQEYLSCILEHAAAGGLNIDQLVKPIRGSRK